MDQQRRVFLFLTISFAVLMLNTMLLVPRRPPEKPLQADKKQEAAEPAGEGVGVEAAPVVDADGEAAEKLADFPEEISAELTYLTLGSVDPDSPYRALFTFTNQGAGVRRVELSNPRYRDLQDRSGYLGQLELTPDPAGGLRVQVVGAGTPAAGAGLQVGDRIISVQEKKQTIEIKSTQQFAELLARRDPGDKLLFTIARGDGQQRLEATLGRRPLEVIRPESANVLMRTKKLSDGFQDVPSFLLTLQSVGKDRIRPAKDDVPEGDEIAGVELRESNWEVSEKNSDSITFRKLLPKYRLELIKRFTVAPIPADQQDNENYPGYGLTLDVEIRNMSQRPLDLSYRLDGPNGLPVEGWWYARKSGRNSAGLRDVVGRCFGGDTSEQSPSDIANGEGTPFEGNSLAFIGVDAQYFAAAVLPNKESPQDMWYVIAQPISLSPKPRTRSRDGMYANVSFRLISEVSVLQPDEALKHSFQVFTGPKRPELLANYKSTADPSYTLSELLYYGWFGAIARGMLAILHTFYGWVGNYGIAIIMLTVVVRLFLFPISRKQAQSMVKMQELKPELDRIKEKYKGDAQKQSQAMQELYRKYNINPLAGCLPMFLQLPIFVGLYRALSVDVELRQAPLISDAVRWCSNLAAPDMFWNWSAVMPSLVTDSMGMGPYLNILPLVTIGLFILQQKMFMPEPTNEQAALQQKIMQYMMIFMGYLFYTVASGLCIYFIASSLWGIAERKLMPMPTASGLTPGTLTDSRPTRQALRNGSTGRERTKQKKKR